MNPSTKAQILFHWRPEWSELTPEAGAAAYNALPGRNQPVTSIAFLAWAGEARRYQRLKAFIAQDVAPDHPAHDLLLELQGAIETLLLGVSNPNAYLDLAPGSGQLQLLQAAVQLGALTVDDVAALLAKAVTSPDASADDFEAAAAQQSRNAIAQPSFVAAQEFQNAIIAWVESGEGELPQFQPPTT